LKSKILFYLPYVLNFVLFVTGHWPIGLALTAILLVLTDIHTTVDINAITLDLVRKIQDTNHKCVTDVLTIYNNGILDELVHIHEHIDRININTVVGGSDLM
jgi:hypothetical protein